MQDRFDMLLEAIGEDVEQLDEAASPSDSIEKDLLIIKGYVRHGLMSLEDIVRAKENPQQLGQIAVIVKKAEREVKQAVSKIEALSNRLK